LTTQVARIDLPNNPKGSEVVIFNPGKLRCVGPGGDPEPEKELEYDNI
jgi:hypothetical protein